MSLPAGASPAPAMTTLLNQKPGLFLSSKGFRLDASDTGWSLSAAPKNMPSLVTIYKAPAVHYGFQPALTVRVDHLPETQTLGQYVKQWMKDYSRFGFDVLKAKPVQVHHQVAFLIDIVARQSEKQLRQVIFLKDKTAVILTCRDHQSVFSQTVKACNQIIRSFEWNSSKDESPSTSPALPQPGDRTSV